MFTGMVCAMTERPLVKQETNGELDQEMKAATLWHGNKYWSWDLEDEHELTMYSRSWMVGRLRGSAPWLSDWKWDYSSNSQSSGEFVFNSCNFISSVSLGRVLNYLHLIFLICEIKVIIVLTSWYFLTIKRANVYKIFNIVSGKWQISSKSSYY